MNMHTHMYTHITHMHTDMTAHYLYICIRAYTQIESLLITILCTRDRACKYVIVHLRACVFVCVCVRVCMSNLISTARK